MIHCLKSESYISHKQNQENTVLKEMVKKVVAIFLMILILLPIFGKSWILISFKINQESIAKNLCVQKNVKNNSCHGCCQLKKRLAEKDNQEQKQLPRGSKEKGSAPSDYLQLETGNNSNYASIQKSKDTNYNSSLPSPFPNSVFRPPQA